ncbi:MAG TPA: hypothetical protein VK558_17030 [Patescibacteria group bacterium]|nr:hypothetical protein [Patescibacteria group bacterium]
MTIILDDAPNDVRLMLTLEVLSSPRIGIYELCNQVEQRLDRAAFHRVLVWADRYCDRIGYQRQLRSY